MENKQTAVKWVFNKLTMLNVIDETKYEIFRQLELEAKEMEKEQIKDACEEGFLWSAEGWNGELISYYKDGEETLESFKEEYYNETYITYAE